MSPQTRSLAKTLAALTYPLTAVLFVVTPGWLPNSASRGSRDDAWMPLLSRSAMLSHIAGAVVALVTFTLIGSESESLRLLSAYLAGLLASLMLSLFFR